MQNNKLMSPEEVELLLNLTLSTESNWNILIGSLDEKLVSIVHGIFDDDEQVAIQRVESGCDFLVECALKKPDMIIIDEELPDIPCEKIIRSIKSKEELKEIQILCSLKEEPESTFPGRGADDYFVKYNLEKVYLKRKINSLLYPYQVSSKSNEKEITERRWPRTKLNVAANIEMVSMSDTGTFSHGEATLVNISRSGAYLTDIKLDKGNIPHESFKIRLKINQPLLNDIEADALIIRSKSEGSAAVKFVNISKDDQIKIAKLFNK